MTTTEVLLIAVLLLLALGAGAMASAWLHARRAAVSRSPRVDAAADPAALITPVTVALQRVEQQLAASERHRAEAHGQLHEQVRTMNETSQLLRTEASSLVQALRAPQTRGRWGEMQLRRVVELAGLVEHCDFTEQMTVGRPGITQRPDLVVHLAGSKNIVVDAKVSIAAYLEMTAAVDETEAAARRMAHARHLRTHIDQLAARQYWDALPSTPEFVVLFVPAEPVLSTALDADPTLLEHAFDQNVVLATPNTLVALLRTVAYTWRQEALTENAQAVLDTGRELHQRLGTLGSHLTKMGSSLESSVKSYNQLLGSLESRVFVTARRFNDLNVVDQPLTTPDSIDLAPRLPQASELVEQLEHHLPYGPGHDPERGSIHDPDHNTRGARAAG